MIIIRKEINKFRCFQFLYWAMVLCITGMYTIYMSNKGFSKKEISIAVTIYTISCLLGQSFMGYIVDKYNCLKKLIFICISTGFIVLLGLLFSLYIWQFYITIFIWGFFIIGLVPLTDSWCIDILRKYGQERNFGRIRGFGSIGYGFSGAILGILLQNYGWKIYYPYIAIIIIINLIIISSLPNDTTPSSTKNCTTYSMREGLTQIIKIKPLIVIIVIIFMYNFVLRGVYNYLAFLVTDYGGGVANLGFTYFFDASPELITFFLSGRLLKKYDNKKIIFLALLLQILRLSIILIFNSATAVMMTGILSGFAFGLVSASYKPYIYNLSPEKYKLSCICISETIIGLSTIISAPIFGYLFTKLGTSSTILIGLIIDILIAIIMYISIFLNKGHVMKID